MLRTWVPARLLAIAIAVAGPALASGTPAPAIDWHAPVDIARGAGERGPWRQNDSDFRFVDDPTVAWAPDGGLAVAWVDQPTRSVRLQRRAGDGSAAAEPVTVFGDRATFSWLPRLAWAPDEPGRLHALWQEIVFSGGSHGGEVLAATSRDGGRRFEPALNLSRSRAGDGKGRLTRQRWDNGSFDIAAAPGGRVVAAWTEYDGRLWTAWSGDGGRSFSGPRLVAGAPPQPPARAPALAVGAQGLVVLAWTTGEDAAADIQVARSTDGGQRFGPPRAAAVTAGHGDAPKLAFDARGTLHLVHHESPGGPAGEPVVVHLRSVDGGASFGAPQVISPGMAAHPSLGVDDQGRVLVVWERMRQAGRLAAQGLGFAVSADGVRFGAPGLVPGSEDPGGGWNGSTQGLLTRKLALRADGEIALVNSALKSGVYSRVWLLRGTLRPAAGVSPAARREPGTASPPR